MKKKISLFIARQFSRQSLNAENQVEYTHSNKARAQAMNENVKMQLNRSLLIGHFNRFQLESERYIEQISSDMCCTA